MSETVKDDAIDSAGQRSTMNRIERAAFGDERPYELAPASFITWPELRRMAVEMQLSHGSTFIDLGCGGGGCGLWVAKETGAGVIGIDHSSAECDAARRRARTNFAGVAAQYRVADMASTGLPDGAVDAAMSIDAVQIAPDRLAVFRDAARVIRSGGRFVLTTFDHSPGMPLAANTRGRKIVTDSGWLLERAGFRVLVYERLPGWRERAVAIYTEILEHREAVIEEVGEAIIDTARWGVAHAHHVHHVFVVAESLGPAGSLTPQIRATSGP